MEEEFWRFGLEMGTKIYTCQWQSEDFVPLGWSHPLLLTITGYKDSKAWKMVSSSFIRSPWLRAYSSYTKRMSQCFNRSVYFLDAHVWAYHFSRKFKFWFIWELCKFETGLIVSLQWNFNLKINGSVKMLLHKSTVVVRSGYGLLVLFRDLQVPCSAGFHTWHTEEPK